MKIKGIKIREFKDRNYKSIFNESTGQTIRLSVNKKPILPLEYPELLDISFGTKCLANCSFCYTSAIKNGVNYSNIVDKINNWWGPMTENQRPFQVAIGGGGEPTLHPEFVEAVKAFYKLGIMPNYTTNAMHLTPEVLKVTKDYCGGVAISCHPHLDKIWKKGVTTLTNNGIRTNLHIIVGETGTTDRFWNIVKEFKELIDYFVILPYQSVGRAKQIETESEWIKLFDSLLNKNIKNVAFGALFYPFILENKEKYPFDISLYEPETMSGYVMMEDGDMIIRKSSYDLKPKFYV
jgi:MoaA/NifB/PqqE/SkfB family radical SAM enzyme